MSIMTADLGGKRLDLLKQIVPGLAHVAVFWNQPNLAYGPILGTRGGGPNAGCESFSA